MKTAKDVLKSIKDNDVKYVDLRFTDPRGKWQHLAHAVETIEEDTFTDGLMFDGSAIDEPSNMSPTWCSSPTRRRR